VSNFHELIQYYDALARNQVDERLYMIMDGEGQVQRTTENTVYARDPLQPISKCLDALKVVPTTPVSNAVTIVAGHFYCGGDLYVFPGITTLEITLHPYSPTTIFVGLRVNRNQKTVTPWVNVEYGVIPSHFPEVIPLALITKRANASEFLSDDIVDIRPFINYDVAIPRDRKEVEIACLGPGEAIAFSRRPYHTGVPFLQVWQRLGMTAPAYEVMHDYRQPSDSMEHWRDFRPYTPLYNSQYLAYDQIMDGVSLRKLTHRAPIEFADLPEIIFVSPMGRDTWPGTKGRPVATLVQALSIAAAIPEKTTIWFDSATYIFTRELVFPRSLTLVGRDPTSVQFRFSSSGKFRCADFEPLILRTLGLYFYGQQQNPDGIPAWIATPNLEVFNCICQIQHETAICAPFFSASRLFISNCVLNNPYSVLNATALIYETSINPPSTLGIQNTVYLGGWGQALMGGPTNLHDQAIDPKFFSGDSDGYFRPMLDSPCIDTGTFAYVNFDIDGSPPDIGLYGGQYASMADNPAYPLNQPAVFKWPVQTFFGTMLQKFETITDMISIPADTRVQAVVSFTGGRTWVYWHEESAAWRLITWEQVLQFANSWTYLKAQLLREDLRDHTEEIVIAFVLSTMSDQRTPTVHWTNFKCKLDASTLVPYPQEELDIFVNDTSVFLRNRLPGKVRNLVVTLR